MIYVKNFITAKENINENNIEDKLSRKTEIKEYSSGNDTEKVCSAKKKIETYEIQNLNFKEEKEFIYKLFYHVCTGRRKYTAD